MHKHLHNEPHKIDEELCEYCGGTGEIATDVDDGEGHIMRGVGDLKPCICQIKK